MFNINTLILFSAAFLGGIAVFLFKKGNNRNLKLVLSFSGAYLFAITVIHLMPEVYQSNDPYIGLFILGGFAFQIILEQFSQGIEHGHIHMHQQHTVAFPFGIMISLSLHAFLEGMPLVKTNVTYMGNNPLVYGIALHHIPAAFALASVLLTNKTKQINLILLIMLFAMMTPLGSFFSQSLQENSLGNVTAYFNYIMATVIGIFLHISTTILFESNVDHRFNFYKMIAIIIGAGIAIINFMIA